MRSIRHVAALCALSATAAAAQTPPAATHAAPDTIPSGSLPELSAWFEANFAALLGATVIQSYRSERDGPGVSRFNSEMYEKVHLEACVLELTNVSRSSELPAGDWSDPRPSRYLLRIPLRDLDPAGTYLRELRDTTAMTRKLVVWMQTTPAAGRTITTTTQRHGTWTGRALGLLVASREDGALAVRALTGAVRLCAADSAR